MRTLYVAAGGGGDAVGALLARRALGDTDHRPPLVTTCAWERLRIDPVPGPRARADFTGLGLVGNERCEVLPDSDTVPAGRSVLPRLAETSGARIFLHDFEGGAVGLATQLRRLSQSLGVDRLVVLDVGGDLVARGSEQGLRSPLADSCTLGAALETGIPTSIVVLGPGVDGELPEGQVLRLLEACGAQQIGRIASDDVRAVANVLCWHPTEATALVAAAAKGVRGAVAMRRGHAPTPLTDHSADVWSVRDPTFDCFPLSELISRTSNLPEAEHVIRENSVDEIDFERTIASRPSSERSLQSVEELVSDMETAQATHITWRRLSDVLGSPVPFASSATRGGGLWSVDELRRTINAQDE